MITQLDPNGRMITRMDTTMVIPMVTTSLRTKPKTSLMRTLKIWSMSNWKRLKNITPTTKQMMTTTSSSQVTMRSPNNHKSLRGLRDPSNRQCLKRAPLVGRSSSLATTLKKRAKGTQNLKTTTEMIPMKTQRAIILMISRRRLRAIMMSQTPLKTTHLRIRDQSFDLCFYINLYETRY